jgi:hypothetical protein
MRFSRDNLGSISSSFIAGAIFSFPASWAACVLAEDQLRDPIANTILGIVVSFIVYSISFAILARQPFYTVFFGLAMKTGFEISLRGLIQVGLMFGGVTVAVASPIAQLIAGFAGHLSIPFFIRRGRAAANGN